MVGEDRQESSDFNGFRSCEGSRALFILDLFRCRMDGSRPMKFLPPGKAARALGLTAIALHRMIAYGEMRAIKRGKRCAGPGRRYHRYLETSPDE